MAVDPITFFVAKYVIKKTIINALKGDAHTAPNPIVIDQVGDGDGKIEIEDGVEFVRHEANSAKHVFDFAKDVFL